MRHRSLRRRIRAAKVGRVAQEQPLISIIDDDESVRTALTGLVRALGYRARAFESAEAFLTDGEAGSACIISDIQMPGMSGVELQERLAQSSGAPMILITARTEAGLHERALASGAIAVLHKPFAAETLIDCLERALAG